MRVQQWHKNVLVFAPLLFSGHIFDPALAGRSFIAFTAFCFAASSVYLFNDILDIESDRQHPEKRKRAIAAGELSVKTAIVLGLLLSGLALWQSSYLPLKFLLALLIYFVLNFLYSWKLKHVAVLEVLLVASMYLLRVIAGTKAIGIASSSWLVLCTFFLALFLVLGKRRTELVAVHGSDSREVLKLYNLDFIEHALSISIMMSIATYALYTVVVAKPYLLYSTFFVVFVLLRYMFLIYKEANCEKPEELLLKDKQIFFTALLWVIYVAFVYYGLPGI